MHAVFYFLCYVGKLGNKFVKKIQTMINSNNNNMNNNHNNNN